MNGSQVFYLNDLANTLRSVLFVTLAQPAPETPDQTAFRQGVMVGISAVAVALGIDAKQITSALPRPQ